MIVVAGKLLVEPAERAAYLDTCIEVVQAARAAAGCLDFALSPDVLDGGRINVYERWADAASLERFRGSGPEGGQLALLKEIDVAEYDASTRA